jgi:hypothetical protein
VSPRDSVRPVSAVGDDAARVIRPAERAVSDRCEDSNRSVCFSGRGPVACAVLSEVTLLVKSVAGSPPGLTVAMGGVAGSSEDP